MSETASKFIIIRSALDAEKIKDLRDNINSINQKIESLKKHTQDEMKVIDNNINQKNREDKFLEDQIQKNKILEDEIKKFKENKSQNQLKEIAKKHKGGRKILIYDDEQEPDQIPEQQPVALNTEQFLEQFYADAIQSNQQYPVAQPQNPDDHQQPIEQQVPDILLPERNIPYRSTIIMRQLPPNVNTQQQPPQQPAAAQPQNAGGQQFKEQFYDTMLKRVSEYMQNYMLQHQNIGDQQNKIYNNALTEIRGYMQEFVPDLPTINSTEYQNFFYLQLEQRALQYMQRYMPQQPGQQPHANRQPAQFVARPTQSSPLFSEYSNTNRQPSRQIVQQIPGQPQDFAAHPVIQISQQLFTNAGQPMGPRPNSQSGTNVQNLPYISDDMSSDTKNKKATKICATGCKCIIM